MESNNDQSAQIQPAFSEADQPYDMSPPGKLPHSGPGIASFVLSVVSYIITLAAIVYAVKAVGGAVSQGKVDQAALGSSIGTLAFVGFAMLAPGIGLIIALVLGIIGLVQKHRLKVFAIIGTVLSGLAVLLIIGLMVLGLLAGGIAGGVAGGSSGF